MNRAKLLTPSSMQNKCHVLEIRKERGNLSSPQNEKLNNTEKIRKYLGVVILEDLLPVKLVQRVYLEVHNAKEYKGIFSLYE